MNLTAHILPRVLAAQAISVALAVLLGSTPVATAQDQQRARERYHRAITLLGQGNFSEAETEILEILRDFPNLPPALNLAGIISDLQGQHQRAIGFFERALSARSDFLDARNNLAHTCLKTKQYKKAMLEFERVLEREPNHAAANYGLAQVLYEMGQFDRSAKAAAHAQSLAPDDPDVLLFLAKIQFRHGRLEDAKETTGRLKVRFQHDGTRLHALGLMLLDNDRYADAVTILQQAAELEGQDPEILQAMGMGYGLWRKLTKAISTFERSIQVNPEQARGHFLLALCYGMQGRYQEAIIKLRNVLAIDSNHTGAAQRLGIGLYKQGLEVEAWDLFEQVLTRQPDRVEALYYQALIRFQQGDYRQSLALLSRVLELDEKHIAAHYKLAQVHVKLGEKETAARFLERFNQLSLERERTRGDRLRIYAGVEEGFPAFKSK